MASPRCDRPAEQPMLRYIRVQNYAKSIVTTNLQLKFLPKIRYVDGGMDGRMYVNIVTYVHAVGKHTQKTGT